MRNPAVELQLAPPLFSADLGEFGGRIDTVCAELARTAAERDRAGGTAFDQRRLLRESGLLALAVPAVFGGAGAAWPVVFRSVRRIAQVDSSLAHLFGFQHLQVATVLLFGAEAQQQRYLVPTASER